MQHVAHGGAAAGSEDDVCARGCGAASGVTADYEGGVVRTGACLHRAANA